MATVILKTWDWAGFNTELAAGAIVTFIAIVVGVPIGLAINRQFEQRQRAHERRNLGVRHLAVLSALEDELEHNIALMADMEVGLRDRQAPYFGTATDIWDAIKDEVLSAIESREAIAFLPRLYVQFATLQRKVDALLAASEGSARAASIANSIREQIPIVSDSATQASRLLGIEMVRLEEATDIDRPSRRGPGYPLP